jgi:hypothetical protein
MLPRYRRLGIAIACLVAITTLAAVGTRDEPLPQVYFITLGLKDTKATSWDGDVTVAGGEVVSIAGWRFEEKDAVDGTKGWKCQTRFYIAPEARIAMQPPPGKTAPKPPFKPWPNGVTLSVKGETPNVTIKLPAGEVKFAAADVPLGEPKLFLDGQVRVERLPATTLVRPPAPVKTDDPVQDDYPAFWVRYKTKKQYLAWVAYQREKDRVLLAERAGPEGDWSKPVEVAAAGDHFRVAVAGTHDDTIWIVWASQRDKVWNLFARSYKDGKLGDEVRVGEGAGPNLWHRMTTDKKGRAWLVWQGFKEGKSQIVARCVDGDGWHKPVQLTDAKANHWVPTIAADTREDRVWVAWDSYATGNYNVQLRSLSGGPEPRLGEILTPEASPRFQANPNVAVDKAGRVWVAWDESGPQWGKDTGHQIQKPTATGLYWSRSINIKCLENDKWLEPQAKLADVLPREMKEFYQMPQMQADTDGRLWLAFRYRTCKIPRTDGWAASGRWDIVATAFLGDRWLPPIDLPQSAGRNDMRADSQRDAEGNVYFAYASDNRRFAAAKPQNLSVAVARLAGAGKPADAKLVAAERKPAPVNAVHPLEAEQLARIRSHKIDFAGKTYHIYRGDLHRHTDISGDGAGDGSLLDLYRYSLDAAGLDFILVADHNMGDDAEYPWWRTQKSNDLYTVPNAFISMYGYERSVPYPNGHRNVIWLNRGHRTLPLPKAAIPAAMKADTGKLYEYLRRTDGICTLHSSATGQGTDWKEEIDPKLEPFVELFQGFHASFEAPGAPRTVDDKDEVVHSSYKSDGFVSLGLEKGAKLGFQASSDHVSTHISYACVLAEEFSRKGLIEGMKKRHSYAATDNIVLDVRMGALGMMGDEVTTAKPGLDVVVLGTGPIDRVDIIRNGEVVHTEKPTKDEARFHWDDPAPPKDDKVSYYYVRVVQKDQQMAWGSPIWVKR